MCECKIEQEKCSCCVHVSASHCFNKNEILTAEKDNHGNDITLRVIN